MPIYPRKLKTVSSVVGLDAGILHHSSEFDI